MTEIFPLERPNNIGVLILLHYDWRNGGETETELLSPEEKSEIMIRAMPLLLLAPFDDSVVR